MSRKIAEISIGHANSIRVQLTAKNVDTGVVTNLSVAQMQAITKVALALGSTKITTGDTGVALGAGNQFDQTVDESNAIIAITLGNVAAMTALVGNYPDTHLDVYFSNVDSGNTPIRIGLFAIKVTQD